MLSLAHLTAARTTTVFLVVFFFLLGISRADEAVSSSGQRVQGELNSDGQGRLLFQPLEPGPPLPLDQIQLVRFPNSRLPPLRAGAAHRILLHGGQHLTGEFLSLDSDKLELHTAWRGSISIPRAALTAVTHLPGFVTIFVDDFEKDLKSWRLAGNPALTSKQHVSGRHSLGFTTPGQAAEYRLATPFTAGCVGINFRDSAPAAGLAWQIEAEFAGATGWRTLRAASDPRAGNYRAEVTGVAAAGGHLPRKEGWQRLEIEFSLDMLVVSIEDEILLSYRQEGAGGALRKVRLSCVGGGGEVFFDDFALARAMPPLPHAKGDPEQDELWLLSGDQLFGTVSDSTASRIRLRGSLASGTISWSEVRGIYFRQSGTPIHKSDGKRVRVWLRPGIGYEPDVLDGTVRTLDKNRLVLTHDVLGELEIERKRVHRLAQK
jgi:hypothetical protein